MDQAVQILADNPDVVQQIVKGADTTYDSYARGNAYGLQSYTDYIRTQDEYGSLQNADKATSNLVKEDTSLELNAGESPIDVCDVDPELCS